jgi:hypothetical protein
MSIDFSPLRKTDNEFDWVAVSDQLELSLSTANGLDLLDALGIEETYSNDPWPIQCCRVLVTVARRKRLGYRSPEIPRSERSAPGRCTFVDCGRSEGYIEQRLSDLSDLLNQAIAAGATHIGWG